MSPYHHPPPPSLFFLLLLPLPPLLLLLTLPERSRVEGHGRLVDPPSRASKWRFGFDSPPDYDDNQGYCGGQNQLWQRFQGRCGVCGDPWLPKPRAHERGGRFYDATPVRVYRQGDVISVVTAITANHRGWMEYRLCPYDDPGPDDVERDDVRGSFVEVTQRCLDRHLLQLADGSGTRFYLPAPFRVGQYSVDVRLPPAVSCQRCLLQWKWNAANSWGTGANGTSCVGCGPQEQFYACADVVIQPFAWDSDDPPDYPPDYPDGYDPDPTDRPLPRPRPPGRVTASVSGLTYYPPQVTYPPRPVTHLPPSPTSLPRVKPRLLPTPTSPPATTSTSTTTSTTTTTTTTTTHPPPTTRDKPTVAVTVSPAPEDWNPPPSKPATRTPSVTSFWQWLLRHRVKQQKPGTLISAGGSTPGKVGGIEGEGRKSWWEKLAMPSQQPFWTDVIALKAMKETTRKMDPSFESSVPPVSTTTTAAATPTVQEAADSDTVKDRTSFRDRLKGIFSLAQRLKEAALSLLTSSGSSSFSTEESETRKPKAAASHGSQLSVLEEQSGRSVGVLPWLQTKPDKGTEVFSDNLQTLDTLQNPKKERPFSSEGGESRMADLGSAEDTGLNNVAYSAILLPPITREDRKTTVWKKLTNQISADASRDKQPTNRISAGIPRDRKLTNHISAVTPRDQPLSGIPFQLSGYPESQMTSAVQGGAGEESRDHFLTNGHAQEAEKEGAANENALLWAELTERRPSQNDLNPAASGENQAQETLSSVAVGHRTALPRGVEGQQGLGYGYPSPHPPYPAPARCTPKEQGVWYPQMWNWCQLYCSRGVCLQAYCLCL